MDAEALATLVFGLIGGLGIFLLGMKNLSDGMQAVAGSSLRRMIAAVTNNRLLAAGVGTLVTCIVQSSSITTVMVVGFVNSGLMTLTQAAGVIMGANIGTTITGWILVLKIGKYGLPMLGGAAFAYLFGKGDRWRYWAMAFMGVGMVFFGLELMKDACGQIEKLPQFASWFQRFQADSYFGVLRCAMVGCILTMLVQSSSATLGITISLAYQGVIDYPTAAALVLGENIGTTITAFLASLGANRGARQAAYFHVLFNVIGVAWITAIFPWYIDLVQTLAPGDVETSVTRGGQLVYPYTTAAIAATHSLFNVANTIAFLPFLRLLVVLLERFVPEETAPEKPRLTSLDVHMLETPVLAIQQSHNEILKMGRDCEQMMHWLQTLLEQDEPDRALVKQLQDTEEKLDRIQEEVSHFITDLLANNAPHTVAEEARAQLRIADEYESISDYVAAILKFDLKLRKEGLRFTEQQRHELARLHSGMTAYVTAVNEAYREQNRKIVAELKPANKQLRNEVKHLRREFLGQLSSQTVPPAISVAWLSALNAYTRVRDHALNIAQVIAGEK